MKPILDEIELGKTEPWNFTASDGTTIQGMMCLPPNFDPNKKYPLIVYYYGGTTPTERGISNPYCAQLFASRDYVVYVINPSGTIGYGQEFSARHVNAWGKRTADDIIEGTKQFCKEHPFVNDKNRLSGCILRRIHDPIPANTNRHLRSRGFACRHQQCDKLLGRRLLGVFI